MLQSVYKHRMEREEFFRTKYKNDIEEANKKLEETNEKVSQIIKFINNGEKHE